MTVDVRAKVFCNLGTVIQGNLADESLSAGQGLITCRGQVVLTGLSTPDVGSIVNFGWVRGNTIARIPRTLRVLSSFADPFRGTTTVQLGDKLVYLANLKGKKAQEETPAQDGSNGPDPADYPSSDYTYNQANACYLPKAGAKPFNFSTPDAANKLTVREEYALAPAKVMGRAPLGISASSVLSKCCAALGLARSGLPLTNVYQDDFDLSSGYVSVIDQLLSSESLFGYLSENETLQIVSFEGFGSGPLITTNDLIDLSGINQGILPGQLISVSFDYKRLKDTAADQAKDELNEKQSAEQTVNDPNATAEQKAAAQQKLKDISQAERQRNWEEDQSVTYDQRYTFTVENDAGTTVYSAVFSNNPTTLTTTTYDDSNYVKLRRSVEKRIVASEVGTILQAVINAKFAANEIGGAQTGSADSILRQVAESELEFVTEETFEYENVKEEATSEPQALPPDKLCPDPAGEQRVVDEDAQKPKTAEKRQLKSVVSRYEPLCSMLAKMNISGYDFSTYSLDNLPKTPYLSEQTITYYDTNQPTGQTKTRVDRYVAYAMSIDGQQYIAEKGKNVTTDNQLSSLLQQAIQLVFSHTEVSLQRDRTFGLQQRPTTEQLQADDKEKDAPVGAGDDQGQQKAELEQKNSTVETAPKTEVAMPLASDDAVVWTASNGYEFKGSNAASMAMRYARTINALLRGNRAGVSLQLAATGMPLYPLSTVYLQAGGLTASYKSNGMSWSFNNDGILCAMDALFISGISGIGSRWFPVAPGITTLPSNPAVTTATAVPANSTSTPNGFNPAAPGAIFSSLPTGQAPVFANSIAPTSGVPVVTETVRVVAGTRSIVSVLPRDYALTLPTATVALISKPEVTVGPRFAADVTALALSGQATALKRGYRVAGAAGSFAVSGLGAGSVRTYGIGTNAGAFSHGGQAALLTRSYSPLNAEAGSVALSGKASQARVGVNLLAAAGSFALTGQSASSTQSRLLTGTSASFTASGQEASLNYISPNFKILTYTGNGLTTNAITGVGFKPGLVWSKRISGFAENHALYHEISNPIAPSDSYYGLLTSSGGANSSGTPWLTFDSSGFTLKQATFSNTNGAQYWAMCLKAGGTPVSNTDGALTTTVSVNSALKFSQFKYDPNGATTTIGHGLGVTPELVFAFVAGYSSGVYVGGSVIGDNKYLVHGSTAEASALTSSFKSFSSTTIGIGSFFGINRFEAAWAYGWAFASAPGISKIGAFTGNGSATQAITGLGFAPSFVMVKSYSGGTSDWVMFTSGRDGRFYANTTAVEQTTDYITFDSDGFTLESGASVNSSGVSYFYLAFR